MTDQQPPVLPGVRHVPLCPVCPVCQASLAFVGCPHTVPDTTERCSSAPTSDTLPEGAEGEVARVFMAYPGLFGRNAWGRLRVVDQLLLTIGNGYDWDQGRLVSRFVERRVGWRTPADDLAEDRARHVRNGGVCRIFTSIDLTFEERYEAMQAESRGEVWEGPDDAELERRIQARWEQDRPHLKHYVNDLRGTHLGQLPANLGPDWLALAWDAYALVLVIQDDYYDGLRGLKLWESQARYGATPPPLRHGTALAGLGAVLARLRALDAATGATNEDRLQPVLRVGRARASLLAKGDFGNRDALLRLLGWWPARERLPGMLADEAPFEIAPCLPLGQYAMLEAMIDEAIDGGSEA